MYVPRGVRVEAPILLTRSPPPPARALQRRMLIVLEEGAEAEVWEQYLSADAESETLLNTVVELVVGQNARLRYVCGQDLNEKSWIFGAQRAEVAARRQARLGRGRLRLRARPRADGDEARRRGRRGARSPAPTRRTPASTSTSTPRRSTRRRTRSPERPRLGLRRVVVEGDPHLYPAVARRPQRVADLIADRAGQPEVVKGQVQRLPRLAQPGHQIARHVVGALRLPVQAFGPTWLGGVPISAARLKVRLEVGYRIEPRHRHLPRRGTAARRASGRRVGGPRDRRLQLRRRAAGHRGPLLAR